MKTVRDEGDHGNFERAGRQEGRIPALIKAEKRTNVVNMGVQDSTQPGGLGKKRLGKGKKIGLGTTI